MPNLFSKEVLKHKMMLIAAGVVVLIAAASIAYYLVESKAPASVALPASAQGAGDITATGVVEPLQNPDLSFEMGGRIAAVTVAVGDRVYTGETLASLDVAALAASRAQAEANVEAQQAKLDSLKAPPRQTDTAIKQSAVSQAKQAELASYAALPSSLSDAQAKSVSAVRTTADALFSNPDSLNPTPIFSTTDSASENAAQNGRVAVGEELGAWSTELSALPATAPTSELDSALTAAVAHLTVVRSFQDSVIAALNSAVASPMFSTAQIAAAESSMSAARSTVNGLVSSLTATREAIVSEGLAVDAANAQLQQLLAGASAQDIAAQAAAVDAAQASVSGIDAQIAENVITAPFSGTVGSVSIKTGEIAAPNTPAITILPDSSLEVSVYVSQIDVTHIAKGDTADVTLDAYGAGKVFPAHVAEVDAAPSTVSGVSAYEVKLSFDSPDASVTTGMTANAAIHPKAQ